MCKSLGWQSQNAGQVPDSRNQATTNKTPLNADKEDNVMVLGEEEWKDLSKGNLIFCCTGSRENFLGWSLGKIIITIILSFRVGISKNKIIDDRIKETWNIMSTQLFALWFNDVKGTKFSFFIYFTVILKKKIILEET